MWSWIEPLRAWAMPEHWLSNISGVLVRSFDYRFESGALTFKDLPIPWNAESLTVEAVVHSSRGPGLQVADFALRVEAGATLVAENMRSDGNSLRLTFRLPVPKKSVVVQLFHRKSSLGQITLPVVSLEKYLDDLECKPSTVHVRLGNRYVACKSFVATQARGILTSVALHSRWILTPILELGLRLQVRDEHDELVSEEAPGLSASQLGGQNAVLVASAAIPKKKGAWRLNWLLGQECICTQEVNAISLPRFLSQLKVCDMRYLIEADNGKRRLANKLPTLAEQDRVGPAFAIRSILAGAVGMARVRVNATVAVGTGRPLELSESEQLVTDGPTLVIPGTLKASDLAEITGFEVLLGRKNLGTLWLGPAPEARFDAEGTFQPAEGFTWDGKAEEELNERLSALLHPGEEHD